MTPVTWSVHPAARARARATAVVAVILLAGLASAEVGQGPGWGAAAIVFLTLSVSGFLWPTRYRLDDQGIEVRHLGGVRRRAWREVRRVDPVPGGVLVSPYARPSVRDRVRGVVLRTERDPAELMEAVRGFRGAV